MWFFFSFEFVYMVDYIDIFLYVEPSLHLRDIAYLVMVDYFFVCSWVRFASILLSIFAFMFTSETGSVILFLCWVFLRFEYQGDCVLIER